MKYRIVIGIALLSACTTTGPSSGFTVACGAGLVLANNTCQLPDAAGLGDVGSILGDADGDGPPADGVAQDAASLDDGKGDASKDAAAPIDTGADAKGQNPDADGATNAPDAYPAGSTISCSPTDCHAKVAGSACSCEKGGCYFASSQAGCVSNGDCCPRTTGAYTLSGSKKVPQPAPVYDVCVAGKCVPPGSSCDSDAQCWIMASGLVSAGACVAGTCTWPTKGLGETCDPKSKTPECAPPFSCNNAILSTEYRCRPTTCDDATDCGLGAKCSPAYKVCVAPSGECDAAWLPCDADKKCVSASCHFDPMKGSVNDTICVSANSSANQYPTGIACVSTVFCPVGSYCGLDKFCHQPPDKSGFPCVYDASTYTNVCANNLACVGGICGGTTVGTALGDYCTANAQCPSGVCALCKCVTSKIAIGDGCTTDESCQSGDCVAGVCAATTAPAIVTCNDKSSCQSGYTCQPTSCKYDPSATYGGVTTVQTCVQLTSPTGTAPTPGIDCVATEFCALTETCAPDHKCYKPTTKAGSACAPGAGCASPLTCKLGVCVSGSSSLAIGEYCTYNSQCASSACVNCQCATSKATSGKTCADDSSCVSADCIAGLCK